MKTFVVKGKKYMLDAVKHKDGSDKLELVPIPKDYEERITKIAKELSKPVNKVEWLKQVLYKMDLEYIRDIEREIKKKSRIKAKRGCYELNLGSGKTMVPILLTD